MKKLTAYQAWKKKQKEHLTDKQYKQLLLDNGILVCKCKDEWLIAIRINLMKCKECGKEY